MDYDSLLELLENRRSIRQIKTDPIPDDYIDKIIEAARWAPSAYNTQPWEFVVIKEPTLRDRVTDLIKSMFTGGRRPLEFDQKDGSQRELSEIPPDLYLKWAKAPVFILLVADRRTLAGLPIMVQYTYQQRDQFYLSSMASAFLNMHLAATTLGLAAQWVSQVSIPMIHYAMKRLLGLPEEFEIYDMIALGYPAVKSRGKFLRSMDKLVHEGICTDEDFRTDEEVNDFLRRSKLWIEGNAARKSDQGYEPEKGVINRRQTSIDVIVDPEACTGCAMCIDACPVDVYEMRDDKSIPVKVDECLGCESCVAVCSAEAIIIKDVEITLD